MTTILQRDFLTGIIPSFLYKWTIDHRVITDIQVYQRNDKLRIELLIGGIDPFNKTMRITTINMLFEDTKIEIRKYLGLEPEDYELMIGFKSNVLLFVK
jgi:hypothetical protein